MQSIVLPLKTIQKISVVFVLTVLLSLALSASVFAQEWVKQDSTANGYDLYDVHAVDQERVWAVGGGIPGPGALGGVIMKTVNGGDSWETVLEHEEDLFGLCFFAGVRGIAVGSYDTDLPSGGAGPTILSTTNGGSTWPQRNPDSDGLSLTDVECTNDGETAFAVGSLANDPAPGLNIEAQILKSTDSGVTWTHLDSNIDDQMTDAFFLSPTEGYLVGSAGKVYRTTNGATFTLAATLTAASGIAVSLNEINCLDMDNCWVAAGGEVVYHTEDGFESYDRVDTGGAVSGMAEVNAIDDDLVWVTGQNQIRHTVDGGTTWEVDASDISTAPYHLLPVNMIKDADFIRQANGNLVGWAVGDIHDTLRRGTDGLVGPDAEPGLVLRYGAPFRCSPVNLTFPVCISPEIPIPTMDENNCPGPYVCQDLRDECDLAYEECALPASETMSECLATADTSTCYPQYEEDVQPCEDAFNICAGASVPTSSDDDEALSKSEEDDEDDDGGISPDNFWWYLDIYFIEPIQLGSVTDDDAKAEKKLQFAKERLLELKEMVGKNDASAAEKAKKRYEKTIDEVKEDIPKIKTPEKVLALEKKLLKHQGEADLILRKLKIQVELQAKTISKQKDIIEEQQRMIEELKKKLSSQSDELDVEVKKKLREAGQEDKLGQLKQEQLAIARAKQVGQNYEDLLVKIRFYEKEHIAVVALATKELTDADLVLNKKLPSALQNGDYGEAIADENNVDAMIKRAYKVLENGLFEEEGRLRAEASLAKKKAAEEAQKALNDLDRLNKVVEDKKQVLGELAKMKAVEEANRAQKIADEKKRLSEEAAQKEDAARKAEEFAKKELYQKDYLARATDVVSKATTATAEKSTTTDSKSSYSK